MRKIIRTAFTVVEVDAASLEEEEVEDLVEGELVEVEVEDGDSEEEEESSRKVERTKLVLLLFLGLVVLKREQ